MPVNYAYELIDKGYKAAFLVDNDDFSHFQKNILKAIYYTNGEANDIFNYLLEQEGYNEDYLVRALQHHIDDLTKEKYIEAIPDVSDLVPGEKIRMSDIRHIVEQGRRLEKETDA